MTLLVELLNDRIHELECQREDLSRSRAEALVQRDRARALACRLEEELALIRRAASARRHG